MAKDGDIIHFTCKNCLKKESYVRFGDGRVRQFCSANCRKYFWKKNRKKNT